MLGSTGMPGPTVDLPISLEELSAALASRDLPALVARLVRERSFGAVTLLFRHAGTPAAPPSLGLPELDAAARSLALSLETVPAPKSARSPLYEELRAVRIIAAEALLGRVARPALSEPERVASRRAATLLEAAGAHARAALVHEELGDDAAAAAAWGASGDLERMEDAHARQDARDGRRRAAADVMRRFDVLLASGERRLALAAVRGLSPSAEDGLTARARAAPLEQRLVRGHGVTLRARGGASLRAALTPARLGRDPGAEIALRDPGVSRLHATIDDDHEGGGLFMEDAGSRGGLRFAGALVSGRFALRGQGELALGATASLRFSATDDGGAHVILRGAAGLDRELLALVGPAPLDLGAIFPEARGLALVPAGDGLRLVRAEPLVVRVAGHLMGAGCDLLRGDVIELVDVIDRSGEPVLVLEVAS
jgi:FHA domain